MSAVSSGSANVQMFLAHALSLENEAAERYEDLADSMEAHNNKEVAGLFRELGKFSRMHAAEVNEKAKELSLDLPHIAPWDFVWTSKEAPENAAFEGAHYLMKPFHALKLALAAEEQGNRYYASVAAETKDAAVAKLAREFADEEAGHVILIEKWLEKVPAPDKNWDQDMDPPVISD
ncbi:MAG TPA: ferritin family protein [Azospirillaceae bacterium]|nr:ferritin family protein [Azospirillaceae bacterium]